MADNRLETTVLADPQDFTAETFRLLLREVTHRCANDLQLVTSLLQLQARKAASPEVRSALDEAADRVAVLAQARDHARRQEPSLASALRHVCTALHSQCEPRSILVTLEFATPAEALTDQQITCLALCVNELMTNAVKHAFEGRESGRIDVAVGRSGDGRLVIGVEDDGAPLPDCDGGAPHGIGLELVRALLRSAGGTLHEPATGSKRFEIVVAPGQPLPSSQAGITEPAPARG